MLAVGTFRLDKMTGYCFLKTTCGSNYLWFNIPHLMNIGGDLFFWLVYIYGTYTGYLKYEKGYLNCELNQAKNDSSLQETTWLKMHKEHQFNGIS